MECFCCKRRNVLPMNCSCPRPGVCRQCLLCSRHCQCGKRARLPGSAKPKPPSVTHPLRGE